ncbi:CBO0543 family protein [Bacillus sp. CGMCC 1.16607]|uniref:CBO0543 family protein n=1 Tax=Bacillus sp. CGMCC 1.16607 TaxID=3351842 RepID=UPI0036351383
MHLFLTGLIGILSFYKGNWREWPKYAITIFYVIILNLLYEVLCAEKLLWQYIPSGFPKSHVLTALLYTFIILPGITLMFLSNFPFQQARTKQFFYIFKWIIVSTIIEYIYIYFKKIELNNGYTYWMEPLFYVVMYTMIRLHYTRPFLSYFLSIIIIITLLQIFDIPLK